MVRDPSVYLNLNHNILALHRYPSSRRQKYLIQRSIGQNLHYLQLFTFLLLFRNQFCRQDVEEKLCKGYFWLGRSESSQWSRGNRIRRIVDTWVPFSGPLDVCYFTHYIFLTGQDRAQQPDQGDPYTPFIEELLASATGKDKEGNPRLTFNDMAAQSAKRRVDAQASNPEFALDFTHKIFGSTK